MQGVRDRFRQSVWAGVLSGKGTLPARCEDGAAAALRRQVDEAGGGQKRGPLRVVRAVPRGPVQRPTRTRVRRRALLQPKSVQGAQRGTFYAHTKEFVSKLFVRIKLFSMERNRSRVVARFR